MPIKETESSHWYTPNGDAAHQWEGKPTTLRTAKKLKREKGLSLYPSVTNILGILDKPGLNRWKVGNGIVATVRIMLENGMLNKKGKELCHDLVELTEAGEDFKQDAFDRAKNDNRGASDFGTRWHAMAEDINNGDDPADDLELEPFVPFYRAWKEQHLGRIHFAELRVVDKELGFAGTADLVCELHDYPDEIFVLEFKTTGKEPKKLTAWPEHCYQLAAYAHGVKQHFPNKTIRTGNVMVSSITPCEPKLCLWNIAEQGNGLKIFMSATAIWQRSKDYTP